MKEKLRTTAIVALMLSSSACATNPAGSGPGSEQVLYPPGAHIEFDHKCSDKEPRQVEAYARMESPDGQARAVATILTGYLSEERDRLRVEVRLQRLKIDTGGSWRDTPWTIRLLANSGHLVLESPETNSFFSHERGLQHFRTREDGTADWITFVEPGEETDGAQSFYHVSPDLGFAIADLGITGPEEKFNLALEIRNEKNGETIQLPGPLVRVPERVWAMKVPAPSRPLGLLETLDPTEEDGLPQFLGRSWKYRKCIEERRAAKRFLGPYVPDA